MCMFILEHYGYNICIRCQGWLDSQLEFTTNEVVNLYFDVKKQRFWTWNGKILWP